MAHEVKCTSCDEKGEHWHWEGKPFMSRNYRGPCNSCGGKKFWISFDMFDVMPLVKRLPLAQLIRLDAELHFDLSPAPASLTLRFLRYAVKNAVRETLHFDYRMTERSLWGWWMRLRYGRAFPIVNGSRRGTPVKPLPQ